MSSNDQIQRFIFDNTDIRGEVISLEQAYQQVRSNNLKAEQGLPESLVQLLGEFLAAACLLSSSLKFDGVLTLQARGDGAVPVIMAESSNQKDLRGVIQLAEGADLSSLAGLSLPELLGKGMLVIIIAPAKGERYQGIVPLEKSSLAENLEDYFAQSEQLKTRFWLSANEHRAAGLMLQALPQQLADAQSNEQHWQTAEALATTVKDDELLNLAHGELLYRLFNELDVRLYDAEPVQFACSCSRERCEKTLHSLGQQELEQIISERDLITIDCHFCNQKYQFGPSDVVDMFKPDASDLH